MNAGSVPDWLTLGGAALAFWFGYRQYVEAQAWKRAEFLATEMKSFFADPDVSRALIFIDYSKIRLDAQGKPADKGDLFDDQLFIRSLAIHTEFEDGIECFTREEMIARAAWDALFTGFERFSHYVASGLISVDDLRPYLDYWVTRVGTLDPTWKDAAFFIAVHRFIDNYRYTGVGRLFDAFGVTKPILSPQGKP